ncbi:condensation domain-containing protein [Streptomyces lichenis]|uniref:Condensation domain-containing protein n=1 Tax=Streptomyces lichenis TaxID=2306967 RepID=A0ABT0IAB6_9ACTN|nr:condensation domain-containing protein [Streptomyces lichenis]MCK8678269.1 condensation domain-containing protein [Streptomyces lichenis]
MPARPSTAPAAAANGALELTSAQADVLSAQRAAPDDPTYNVGQYVDLTGPLDTELLRRAVARTLAEAPGLRLRVWEEGGRAWQQRLPFDPEGWRLPRLDTTGAADPVAAAVELVRDQLACPPRLQPPSGEGPPPALTGTVLVRVGPERHLLFSYFHHLAVDGYGVALLTRRIADLYTAAVRGTEPSPSPFAPLEVLVAAEREYAGSAREAADRAHWAARYADRPAPVRFPAAGTTGASSGAARHTVLLDREDSALLAKAVRPARATWAEAVTAALAARLHRDTGATEAVFRMYVLGRTAPGALRVPGMAVNVLPVRIAVDGAATFRELLERTVAEFAAVREHQRFRGEVLAREIWPGAGSRAPSVALLNLRPFPAEVDFAGLTGRVVTLASGPVDDVSLSVVRHPDGRLRLDLDADTGRYGTAGPAALAERYTALLLALAAAPDTPLADLPEPAVPTTSLPHPQAVPAAPTQGETR